MNYKTTIILCLLFIGVIANVSFSDTECRFRSIGETNFSYTFVGGIAYYDGEFKGYVQLPLTIYDEWIRFSLGSFYMDSNDMRPVLAITTTCDKFLNLSKHFTIEAGFFIPLNDEAFRVSNESIGVMMGVLKYNF